MIHIVDYGVGNVQALLNSFKRIGVEARRTSDPDQFSGVTHLILPGVGHFDDAMQRLNKSGMRPALEQLVLEAGVPVLGICVGMQMLAQGSKEGILEGLNWIPGEVKAFHEHPLSLNLPSPHMGWNSLQIRGGEKIFNDGFDVEPQFYFLHSFYFDAVNKEDVVATSNYGFDFDAAIAKDNIYGVQFHPEKSHHWGQQLLANFIEI